MGKNVIEIERFPATDRNVALKRPVWKTVAITAAITFVAVSAIAAIASYFYWQHLKTTPQYSLALIVDAAKRDEQATVNELVDIDLVVDDFLPQIIDRAVDLYGRGLPQETIERVARIAAPVMPSVKSRARDELPGAIRQKTASFGNVPFAAMVIGADKYLDVSVAGDTATVRSRLPEHNFEVRMKKSGERWKIAGLRDEELATRIAQRIGQEIVAIAINGTGSSKSRLDIRNINELLRQAEEIFR